jgi:glycosyltransferase involved in cell wall biosynthesis/GT2 family glycosyltransferase
MRVLRVFHSAVVDAWRERERQLRLTDTQVDLITARRWNEGGADVRLAPRPGEPVRGLRTWGRHPALFVYSPLPLWRALGGHYDVIDIHEEPFALATAEILLLRTLRRQRAPYVLYSAQNIEKRYPVPFRWLERWALRNASGVSVCNAEAGRICERKGLSGRARLIPLGVDLATFSPSPASRPPGRVVGYVGRLAPHKGVDVLVRAVAGLDGVELRIAGAGPDDARLHALVDELGAAERVQFAGSLTPEQLPGFYRALDVLAVPSIPTPGWLEQFGRVVVEAMACGVPVVASDSGALPDVVGDAGLLVPPGDADALGKTLQALLEDTTQRRELAERGLVRARQASWPEVARAYRALYEEAVGPTRRRQSAPRGVEVVVVAYGRPDLLARALEPVRSFPVVVVDNSSSPAVAEVCARLGVRYLDPGHNGGFGAGVNHALRHRSRPGDDVLLLNPDAVIEPDDVRRLHRALLDDPTAASVAPTQVDESGRPAKVSWPFPSPGRSWAEALGLGRVVSRFAPGDGFVIGSVLMLRSEALDQVGGFDEDFFLYAEETDWAYRARRLGWRHREVPDAVAVHAGAAMSADSARRDTHFHASQERYLRKHYGTLGWQVARAANVLGASARGVVLGGDRGRRARARAALYVTGPLRAEGALPPVAGHSADLFPTPTPSDM